MLKRFPALLAALLLSAVPYAAQAQGAQKPAVQEQEKASSVADKTGKNEESKPAAQTLQDVLRWSYQSNPTIRAARAELMATQESLPQAQAGWKPSADLSADADWIDIQADGGSDSDTLEKNIGVDASQPLYRGGRTVSGIESAKNAIMAQRAFLAATEQDVLLQVVTAYMNVIRDQSLLDLAVNNKDVIGRQLDATKARFDVGDVTRTDVSQSEARLALAEATRVRALGNLRGSLAVFEQVTGMPPGSLRFPELSLPIPATLDESVNAAEQYNPSVLAAEFLHNAAAKDIRTVFGELLPTVGLFASLDHAADPSPGTLDSRTTTAFGIQASIPLYEAGATRSRVREAKNFAMQRKIEITEAKRLARQQAVSSWESLKAAQSEILSRKAQVEASRIAQDGVHKEAELGTRTILDALDADQELLDAESALVTAQRNEVVARFTLAATLGLMTPEVLGFPELAQDYNAHLREITGKVFSTDTAFGRDMAAKDPE